MDVDKSGDFVQMFENVNKSLVAIKAVHLLSTGEVLPLLLKRQGLKKKVDQ